MAGSTEAPAKVPNKNRPRYAPQPVTSNSHWHTASPQRATPSPAMVIHDPRRTTFPTPRNTSATMLQRTAVPLNAMLDHDSPRTSPPRSVTGRKHLPPSARKTRWGYGILDRAAPHPSTTHRSTPQPAIPPVANAAPHPSPANGIGKLWLTGAALVSVIASALSVLALRAVMRWAVTRVAACAPESIVPTRMTAEAYAGDAASQGGTPIRYVTMAQAT